MKWRHTVSIICAEIKVTIGYNINRQVQKGSTYGTFIPQSKVGYIGVTVRLVEVFYSRTLRTDPMMSTLGTHKGKGTDIFSFLPRMKHFYLNKCIILL